jgi:hypothetical protein
LPSRILQAASPIARAGSTAAGEILANEKTVARACTEGQMEIMKIGGILLLVALALWIIKSLFDWWGERRDTNKWWEQYKTKTSSWDERRGELESNLESEDDNARRR